MPSSCSARSAPTKVLERRNALLLAAALLAASAIAAPQTHTVVIEGMRFHPETLTLQPGDRVVWVNQDVVPHTATAADNKAFDSRSIAPKASWTYRPRKAGTIAYVCSLHPTMKGTLVVR
jgi:plastocyanin